MTIFDSTRLTRRSLLATGAAVGLSATVAGCSNAGRGGTALGNDQATKEKIRPNYVSFEGVKPDLDGAEFNIPDAFIHYPSDPVQATDVVPGDGEPIKVMTYTNTPIPPRVEKNTFWQELNERVGSPIEINLTSSVDYSKKFATSVAGGKLGDLFMLGNVPQKPQMLEAKAVDLTPHLSGANIEKYPFLANLPEASWNATMFNGKVFGIPIPRGSIQTQVLYARKDILDDLGLPAEIASAEEFRNLCKELTDKRKNRFALATVPSVFVRNMYQIPNGWTVEGDTLVSAYEHPGYEDALSLMAEVWKAGYAHPDSFTGQNQDKKNRFGNGTGPLVSGTFSGWPAYLQSLPEDGEISIFAPPAYDGSGPGTAWLGQPTLEVTVVSKDAEDRIETMLQFLNHLAIPFGTKEHLFRKFGDKGVHHSIVDGNPVLTDKGLNETRLGLNYTGDGPYVVYLPEQEGATQACFDAMKEVIPTAVENPVSGMFSETDSRKGRQINGDLGDLMNEIIQGRKKVSDWAAGVKKWKSGGGDTIAKELYEAYQASQ